MSMRHNEMIAVIQAHRDGKAIQLRWRHGNRTWISVCPHPNWHFDEADYRIKPEPPKPREWWIRSHRDNIPCGQCGLFTSKQFASNASLNSGEPIIHVCEVLPDEEGK